MRFSLVTLALFVVAAATVRSEQGTDAASGLITDVVDELGNTIQVIETQGDHDFDEDDDDSTPTRRSRKHQHGRRKANRSSTHMTSKPSGAETINGNTQITWYASHDLQNPQCGTGGWNPTNNAHIGAVMAGWSNGPKCGEFVYLCNDKMKSDNNCLQVRVIDKCAGCKKNHVDLTKSAFKQLDPKHSLDTGVVKDLKLYSAPKKPSPWDKALFGPVKLAI